jgi:hypothetical protein
MSCHTPSDLLNRHYIAFIATDICMASDPNARSTRKVYDDFETDLTIINTKYDPVKAKMNRISTEEWVAAQQRLGAFYAQPIMKATP